MIQGRSAATFEPIAADYRFQKVAAALRQAVTRGELAPGDRLPPQRELQKQFGVSKPTIVGALRVLEADGLIRTQVGRNGGAVVLDPGASALARGLELLVDMERVGLDEVRELREVVEVQTARRACVRATAGQVAHLEELVTRLEALQQAPQVEPTLEQHGLLDLEFHLGLAGASGNRLLRACMDVLYAHLVRTPVRVARADQLRLDRSLRRLLEEGIKARSPDAAERAITQHLADSYEILSRGPPTRRPRLASPPGGAPS
jgi:GntR family transcriptional repressor for pyruvate dehydrogenase complex